jgi:hypothetical protein
LDHARAGVAAGDARMSGLFQARWDQLSDLEQRYVAAVANLGPAPAPVAAVAQVLGRSTQQLSTTRAALIEEAPPPDEPRLRSGPSVPDRFQAVGDSPQAERQLSQAPGSQRPPVTLTCCTTVADAEYRLRAIPSRPPAVCQASPRRRARQKDPRVGSLVGSLHAVPGCI